MTATQTVLESNEVATTIAEAIRSGSKLAGLTPATTPTSLPEAYRIQDVVLGRLGSVGGWKVAPAKPGKEPKVAPIPAAWIRPSGANFADIVTDRELEVELAVLVDRDIAGGQTSRADVEAALGGVLVAVELLRSRFGQRGDVDPNVAMADLQSCAAVAFGPVRADWRSFDFASSAIWLSVDGTRVGKPKDELAGKDAVLDAVAWLANDAIRRGRGLKAGDVIITGARLKRDNIPSGAAIEAGIDNLQPVRLVHP